MDGRQKPDPQLKDNNDLNDNEIIDLTQIFEGEDDDDIIDLDEILEQPDQALDAADKPEEGVIPLVDAISTEETADLPGNADDGVIDLLDVSTTLEAGMAGPEHPTPQSDEEAQMEEEGVIDLLDMAATDTPEKDVGTSPPADEAEDVINLLDAVEPETAVPEDNEFADLESRAEAMLDDTTDSEPESGEKSFDVDMPEETTPTTGPDTEFMALEEDETTIDEGKAPATVEDQQEISTNIPESIAGLMFDGSEPVVTETTMDEPEPVSESIALTEAQVEAALERVIEKTYGEKIEQLMVQTIEKTVKREIEKIKNALIEDSDDRVG